MKIVSNKAIGMLNVFLKFEGIWITGTGSADGNTRDKKRVHELFRINIRKQTDSN